MAVQLGCDRLAARHDFDGVTAFLRDVLDVCGSDITLLRKRQHRVDELLDTIPDGVDILDQRYDELRETCQKMSEDTRRDVEIGAITTLPSEWYEGTEKVGIVHTHKSTDMTLATKMAKRLIKMNGEDASHAPRRMTVVRDAEVQIRAGALKMLNTMLVHHDNLALNKKNKFADDGTLQAVRLRDEAESGRSGGGKKKSNAKTLSAAASAATSKVKQADAVRIRTMEGRRKADTAVNKLAITAMPARYRIDPAEMSVRLDEKTLVRAVLVRDAVYDRRFGKDDHTILDTTLERWRSSVPGSGVTRLHQFISSFRQTDPFPPSASLGGFAISKASELSSDSYDGQHRRRLTLSPPSNSSSVDLWALHSDLKRRYDRVIVRRDSGATTTLTFEEGGDDSSSSSSTATTHVLRPNMWSWDTATNVHAIEEGKVYFVDLREYEHQTAATPLICGGYAPDYQYLMNHDKYRTPADGWEKAFCCFEIGYESLFEFFAESQKTTTTTTDFIGRSSDRAVFVNGEGWPSAVPWRLDGHSESCWPEDTRFSVSASSLRKAWCRLNVACRDSRGALFKYSRELDTLRVSDLFETQWAELRGTTTGASKANAPPPPPPPPSKKTSSESSTTSSASSSSASSPSSWPSSTSSTARVDAGALSGGSSVSSTGSQKSRKRKLATPSSVSVFFTKVDGPAFLPPPSPSSLLPPLPSLQQDDDDDVAPPKTKKKRSKKKVK